MIETVMISFKSTHVTWQHKQKLHIQLYVNNGVNCAHALAGQKQIINRNANNALDVKCDYKISFCTQMNKT